MTNMSINFTPSIDGALVSMLKCDPYYYPRQLQGLLLLDAVMILIYLFVLHDNPRVPWLARELWLFAMVCLVIGSFTMTLYKI